jgi:hypothetical protein
MPWYWLGMSSVLICEVPLLVLVVGLNLFRIAHMLALACVLLCLRLVIVGGAVWLFGVPRA